MISGLEPILKWSPIAGAIFMVAVGYGQLSSDIRNLQTTQVQQFSLIQAQLAAIDSRLNQK